MGTCTTPIIFAVSILLFVIIVSLSNGSTKYDESYHKSRNKRKYYSNDRICRCVPRNRIALHSQNLSSEDWGEGVTCPVGTTREGEKLWCTSNSEYCTNIGCNSPTMNPVCDNYNPYFT